LVAGNSSRASTLKISLDSTTRLPTEVEADYTVSHTVLNELAQQKTPITVFFDPQMIGVERAEVFTNLNRREFADRDANGDGVPDGIEPPRGNSIAVGDDFNYYKAYPMYLVSGGYQLTLSVAKCGVYRVTARYRLLTDPAGTYRWYGDEIDGSGIHKRDHCVVASPPEATTLQIYEANPLTILATSAGPQDRGTLAVLARGLGPGAVPAFSLAYLKALGCNTIWLQPVHPRGLEGRQTDPTTNLPYSLGSPYSVRNFFAVMPLMAKAFIPGADPAANDTPAGRAEALAEFQEFVKAADDQGIAVMLDAPFNHTAPDLELGADGARLWGARKSTPAAAIRDVEPRVFSRFGEYDERAASVKDIAQAPDRFDFGKWSDVRDLYFGRYASLVPNQSEINNYKDEEDYFDYSVGAENQEGPGNGHFDRITQNLWRFFGDYIQYWLTQTGYPENVAGLPLATNAGIDGLRADFAQGLPPQCWEYIINRTRSRKWNFVFMAESLDGGPVTYRSGRHFDILNENTIYELHSDQNATDFENTYISHRNALNGALVLLNTSSQDEDNYKDPFEALLRFAANSTMDGATMIFPGQELGLTGTIVPPHDTNVSEGAPFGYERYEIGFGGKPIPQFKTYNSMMPLWRSFRNGLNNSQQLHDLYEAIGIARSNSPALRSPTRSFLRLKDGSVTQSIFAVAKFELRNADPRSSDVVLAFINLTPHQFVSTRNGNGYDLNLDDDRNRVNDFGIQPDRLYNVRNLAAYQGVDRIRRSRFLWNNSVSGRDLLKNGISIQFNAVPIDSAGWGKAPYEAQYLKLVDVTP
jgi:hypothetical protein